jgi:hypothetical protein
MNPALDQDLPKEQERPPRDIRVVRWGLALLVVGIALIAFSPLIIRTAGRRSAYDELTPFLGLGLFAAGWVIIGVGIRPRGSALVGGLVALLLYEVAGFAAAFTSQAIAFHEPIGALLRQPLALLGFVQMWPIGLMFAFQVFGWGPP